MTETKKMTGKNLIVAISILGQVLAILLKLTNVISFSWVIVLSPVLLIATFYIVFVFIAWLIFKDGLF